MTTPMNFEQNQPYDRPAVYQITVPCSVNVSWSDWFNGMILEMTTTNQDSGHTTMLMNVPDQAALRGILNKMWDLNLSLISVTLIEE